MPPYQHHPGQMPPPPAHPGYPPYPYPPYPPHARHPMPPPPLGYAPYQQHPPPPPYAAAGHPGPHTAPYPPPLPPPGYPPQQHGPHPPHPYPPQHPPQQPPQQPPHPHAAAPIPPAAAPVAPPVAPAAPLPPTTAAEHAAHVARWQEWHQQQEQKRQLKERQQQEAQQKPQQPEAAAAKESGTTVAAPAPGDLARAALAGTATPPLVKKSRKLLSNVRIPKKGLSLKDLENVASNATGTWRSPTSDKLLKLLEGLLADDEESRSPKKNTAAPPVVVSAPTPKGLELLQALPTASHNFYNDDEDQDEALVELDLGALITIAKEQVHNDSMKMASLSEGSTASASNGDRTDSDTEDEHEEIVNQALRIAEATIVEAPLEKVENFTAKGWMWTAKDEAWPDLAMATKKLSPARRAGARMQ